jgi:hypothetical protein
MSGGRERARGERRHASRAVHLFGERRQVQHRAAPWRRGIFVQHGEQPAPRGRLEK